MEEEKVYNPYTGGYVQLPTAGKVKKELLNRTTQSLRDARNTDPELVINVALILFLQLLLFRFLVG